MSYKKPMCQCDPDEIGENDVVDEDESDGVGGTVKATHFSDGSTTYHFGGMAGDVRYDKYGKEC